MNPRIHSGLRLGLAAASFLAGTLLYSRLPGSLPVHWNAHMQANGFLAKPWGVWIFPAMTAIFAAMAELLPMLSPKGFELKYGNPGFQNIMSAIAAFAASMAAIVYAGALGLAPAQDRLVGLAIGILIATLGNVLSKVPRNFFIGIRTPWTLANEEVWLRTHRLGGRLICASGLLVAGTAVCGIDTRLAFLSIIAAALFGVIYSFVIYRKLEGGTRRQP